MTVLEFLAAASDAKPGMTIGELVILGCAWLRVSVDGDDPAVVACWTKDLIDPTGEPADVTELRAKGLSVRQIARQTGLSKSTIARRLSQRAA